MPQCEATCVQTFERGHESTPYTPYTPLLILNNEAESPMRAIKACRSVSVDVMHAILISVE